VVKCGDKSWQRTGKDRRNSDGQWEEAWRCLETDEIDWRLVVYTG
jgi:hypothetical protein